MRCLPVAELSRSIAFFQDVLGFEIREQEDVVEAVLGPARIRFGNEGYGPADSSTPKPSGSAIPFLESADVQATRNAIVARAGNPSTFEKVNWIKMRMFDIRRSRSQRARFGQSYHKHQDSPSRRDAQSRGMWQALPELRCDNNVAAAVPWYRDVLGSRVNYQQHDLGVMDRDAITVLLIARTDQHKDIGSCEVFVSDADAPAVEPLPATFAIRFVCRTITARIGFTWY